jgi:hypothetical protein
MNNAKEQLAKMDAPIEKDYEITIEIHCKGASMDVNYPMVIKALSNAHALSQAKNFIEKTLAQ